MTQYDASGKGVGISSLWRDVTKRKYTIQVLVLVGIFVFFTIMLNIASDSLQKQNIASGFGFLEREASFEIGETLTEYSAESTFGEALLAGLLNTLLVALLGNFFAVVWGTLVGITSISHNLLLARLARIYVDTLRNIPLLLQLFFWYALITEFFPAIRNALNPLPNVYFSQRGLFFSHPRVDSSALVGVVSTVGGGGLHRSSSIAGRSRGNSAQDSCFLFIVPWPRC